MKRTPYNAFTAATIVSIGFLIAACGSSSYSASIPKTTTPAATAPAAATAATTAATTAASASPAETPPASTASSAATTEAVGGPATVQLAASSLGKILATADGMTLYIFTPDSGGKSVCNGGCAKAWPAIVGKSTPGTGLDAEDFATITRDDGTLQATFYGRPLYLFAGDAKPGDVAGQGSGGSWWVVDGDGNPVGAPAAAPTAGTNPPAT